MLVLNFFLWRRAAGRTPGVAWAGHHGSPATYTTLLARRPAIMPRSGFRRRGARMRYAAGLAESTDATAAGGDVNAALPPPPIGMPFSRRGRRRRQAPGDTGSVLPKLLMKMVVYGIVIVAMKYGKKEEKGGTSEMNSVSGSPTSRIVARVTSLLDDVLGKSRDRVLLPGTKTLRVGTGGDRAANVYVVPNFLLNDVASRWRDAALYEFKRSGGSIPDSHPLSSEVIKTLGSSDVQRKFHALGIDDVEGDTAHIAPYSSIFSSHDGKNANGWKLIIPLSDADASSNDASTPTIQFACTVGHADKKSDQNWCENVQLLHNTAVILEGAAKFQMKSSSGDDNHYVGAVLGTFQKKANEEL